MKKKVILSCVTAALIIFSFSGCRNLNPASSTASGTASVDLNSEANRVSSLEPNGSSQGGEAGSIVSSQASGLSS